MIFGDNHKVSVLIGKLMTRGFQNTPYFWILLKIEGAMALQNKAYYFVWHSVKKGGYWHDFSMQVEIFYLHFLSSLWSK